jgi:spore maturation protein CgeB
VRIAFYGSSLLSSYWNGAATYYRGLIAALARLGWRTTFHEPDAFGRQERRDLAPPAWCDVRVYRPDPPGMAAAAARAAEAEVVVVASGIGVDDAALMAAVLAAARPDALRLFWDVDAPATLAALAADPEGPLRRTLPALDAVLTYGGGPTVLADYRALGAREAFTVHNALDPATHHPAPPDPCYAADLGFLGNRLPDREARVDAFFFEPARRLPTRRFLMGGAGWEAGGLPGNVRLLGHVPSAAHNAFNCSLLAVLNVTRDAMAARGHAPPTRLFEAAGAGACLVTDAWDGIEAFLAPGEEVLVARDGADVAEILAALTPARAAAVGRAARARLLAEHTYDRRAAQVAAILAALAAARRERAA